MSVIGLVDPPYQGRHFVRPYTHVWITIIDGGQINFLEENEDRYRRGSGKLGTGDATNQRILSSIRGSSAGASTPSAPSQSTLVSPQSANARILQKLKGQTIPPTPSKVQKHQQIQARPSSQSQQTSSGFLSGFSGWVWWLSAFIVYMIILALSETQ